MEPKFIYGTPQGLEKHIAAYSPPNFSTNISPEELRRAVVGYIPKPGWSYTALDGEKKIVEPSEDIYLFFPKQKDSIEIPLGDQNEVFIAPQLVKYWFPLERKVKISPQRLELKLSDIARTTYELLLGLQELPLTKLLGSVGFIENDSMEYDFEKLRRLEIEAGKDPSKWDPIQKGYKPTRREKIKGICTDAGGIIRKLLLSLGLDTSIGFTHVRTNDGFSNHDTTLVFDKQDGRWVVINSKSPTKDYILIPKYRLPELGQPYNG